MMYMFIDCVLTIMSYVDEVADLMKIIEVVF
jgi:hypothetical protein